MHMLWKGSSHHIKLGYVCRPKREKGNQVDIMEVTPAVVPKATGLGENLRDLPPVPMDD